MQLSPVREGLSVGIGAGVGALARYLILLALSPGSPEEIALALTFAVNLAACYAMGRWAPGPFWGMGFLGGFSTLSAVALASAHETPGSALVTITLSFTTAMVAWFAGDAVRRARGGVDA